MDNSLVCGSSKLFGTRAGKQDISTNINSTLVRSHADAFFPFLYPDCAEVVPVKQECRYFNVFNYQFGGAGDKRYSGFIGICGVL